MSSICGYLNPQIGGTLTINRVLFCFFANLGDLPHRFAKKSDKLKKNVGDLNPPNKILTFESPGCCFCEAALSPAVAEQNSWKAPAVAVGNARRGSGTSHGGVEHRGCGHTC